MDPLTQATFGAAAAQLSARKKVFGLAVIVGALGGMAPDLDIVIRSEANPLLSLQYHRHFTHSILMIPFVGAAVAAGLWGVTKLWAKLRHKSVETPYKFKDLFVFATVGAATHGFVDAMTSYGTVLLWPFTEARYAWDWASIIDPLITFPLIFGVWLAYKTRKRRYIAMTCGLMALYIFFLSVWHARTETVYQEFLANQGIEAPEVRVMPLLFHPLTYRAVFRTEDQIIIANIKNPLFDAPTVYPRGGVPLFDKDTYLKQHPGLEKYLNVYSWFTDGYVGIYQEQPLILGDYRYGRFDTPLTPLWAIKTDPVEDTVSRISMRMGSEKEN